MTKTDTLILKYKHAFKELHGHIPKVEKKGAWIYINDSPTAHRSSELTEMILRLKKMKAEKDNPPEPVKDEAEDIRALISAIRQDGRHIFRSTDLKKMQNAGKRIAKMAKRILNILDEGEL